MESDLKTRIREEALQLFRKISYSKTSVSDIAVAAGIGKGTIYLYYKSKEEIMTDILKTKVFEIYKDKEVFYLSNEFTLKQKLEKFIILLVDSFVEIKDLLFGSFENLQGRIIKDVFASFPAYREPTVSYLIKIMKFEKVFPDDISEEAVAERIDEFLKYIIGRIIVYVLDTDWNNLDPLKEKLISVVNEVFTTLIINRANK